MTNKTIEAYELHLFLQAFQEAVIEGYRLDLTTNENFPQKFGGHMYVNLVTPEELTKETTVSTLEVIAPHKVQVTPVVETSKEVFTESSIVEEPPVVASEEQAQVAAKVGRPKKS